MIEFAISGVHTYWWLPPLVAFVVSFFTSMGGVSGAFLLLPFQMSVLGFTTPAVSPTNLVYNVVAIPSGVYRYFREGRMVWSLMWVVVAGTLPGVVAGAFIRIHYLPDPGPFKVFVGCVLLYIGLRMIAEMKKKAAAAPVAGEFVVTDSRMSLTRLSFKFQGRRYQASTPGIFAMALAVGVVGGVYGIGGGAIVAPFFVSVFGLPIYTVAGAALMGTFVTSIAGVAFYQIIAPYYAGSGLSVAPDWFLGALFGLGGLAGMYCGARLQRLVPARWIKLMLIVILVGTALRYILGYFLA